MGAPDMIVNGTAAGGPPIGGTGTPNTIPRWTGASTLGDSGLIDNGTAIYTTTRDVGFGIASPNAARFQSVGVDDKWSARLHGSTTVGKSYGALIEAGTNSGDIALRVRAAGAGSDYLYVRGDGNVGIGWASPGARLHVTQGASGSFANLLIGSAGTSTNFYDANEHYWRNGTLATGMYMNASGNVGIGTASPSARLHVSDNSSIPMIVQSSGSTDSYLRFINTSNNLGYIGYIGTNLYLAPNNGAGSVGIGTASPASRLDVAGTITCDDAGTGLKLPATPGNADTQTLDCYQEGTLNTGFTLTGITASAGNVNYEARWVRIGRAVSLRLRIFPDAGAQITFAAGATVVMTGTPAATSTTAMAAAANDGPSGRASALWDTNTIFLNTAFTFGTNVQIYFNGTAV